MLRSLLAHADDDPQTATLARDGGEAFVSQSLRPYLIAALLDRDPGRPAIVVAGDDRAARDLAAGLRAWLEPRSVRYYPSRGVTYESHLVPPPHLTGLRIAALDSLLQTGEAAPVVVVSAVALSEKVPDPSMRPHGFE
ncbi:MAG: transcription-repair coupling factor, partial [Solirubrobacteraceae bacterium]